MTSRQAAGTVRGVRGTAADPPSRLPRGRVTLLFSDIEGSTRLLNQLGEDYPMVLAEHNRLLRDAIARHGGQEVSTAGDSFFVAFEDAAGAIAAAADAQRAIAEHGWPAGAAVRVRMGIHTGEPAPLEDDYAGLDVHRAARIASAAHGGQILISAETVEALGGPPAGGRLRRLGLHTLKDLPEPEDLWQVCIFGLSEQFGPLRVAESAPAAAGHMLEFSAEDLLERSRELEEIRRRVETAREGHGGVLLVEGVGGIGKTQLLRAAAGGAAMARMNVLMSRGSELERELGFGIVRQLFEAPVVRADSSRRAELLTGPAEAAAEALGLTLDGMARPASPQADEFSIFNGLFWLSANLASRAPLLLAVDDAHLADRPSARWLAYLAGRIANLPVLLVLTARAAEPGAERDALQSIAAEPLTARLRPAPLSLDAVGDLLERGGAAGADRSFCRACHSATGGNPFLAEELARAVADAGLAPTRENAPQVLSSTAESISRNILTRLGRLPARAEALARAVAILGTRVELRHAAAVAELTFDQAAGAADVLAAAHVLGPARPLEFLHPIVRGAVYADVPAGERARVHARAARILAADGVRSDRVAIHLLAADEAGDPWTVDLLRRAAAEARPEEAVTYLRRALREPPPPEQRGEVLLELGEAETLAFQELGTAIGHLREGLAAVRDPSVSARASLALSGALLDSGEPLEALDAIEAAVEDLEALRPERGSDERELLLRCEAMRLTARDLVGRPLDRDSFERLAALAAAGATAGERVLLANLAYDALVIGATADEAVALASRALAGGRLLDDRLYFDHHVATWALEFADDLHAAQRAADAAIEAIGRRGSAGELIFGLTVRGVILLRSGRLADAEADVRSALDRAAETDMDPAVVPLTYALWIDLLTDQGRLEEAQRAVGACGFSPQDPASPVRAFYFHARGRLHAAAGRPADAIEDFRVAGRMMRDQSVDHPGFYPWRSSLALLLAPDDGEARALVDEELALAREWGARRPLGAALRAAGLLRGPEGLQLLEESVAILEESPAVLERARSLIDLGAALRRTKRRSDARDPLRRGLDLAHRCGARPLEQRAAEELAATGARPRRAVLTGVDALTASELRVARMAAQGLSNREIAQTLFVSMATVDKHLGSAYRKLDVNSRRDLPAALGVEGAAAKQ